jgi:Tol biopolymer transport system component
MRLALGIALSAVAALAFPAGAYERPGQVERASLSPSGGQLALGSGAEHSLTPDGRFVAFVAMGPARLPAVNPIGDVYVLDRLTHRSRIASVTPAGSPGIPNGPYCGGADHPAISADGRYVTFASCYMNLSGVVGDVGGGIYLHDMKTGATQLVSVSHDGKPGLGLSLYPTISADGRRIAFQSTAKNLVPESCPESPPLQQVCQASGAAPFADTQVFVRDVSKGTTTLVSAGSDGGIPDGKSTLPSISADGRYTAFTSNADNITSNDHNLCTSDSTPSCPDVYLRDLQKHSTELISVGLDGNAASGRFVGSYTEWVQGISGDDRYVAFESSGGNLVPNSPAGGFYVRDRVLKRTSNVGVDSFGQPVHSPVDISISSDGRYFAGDAVTGLIPCSANEPSPGVATVYDSVTGAMQVLGRTDYKGQTIPCSEYYNDFAPEVLSGGRFVSFQTNGAHIVRGDTNKAGDVFVQDRGPALGTGGLLTSGRLALTGAAPFQRTGVVSRLDPSTDVGAALDMEGANLIGATVAYRPQLADMFVRLSVHHMPTFALSLPALVYGVDLTIGGPDYEVRVSKTGVDATFALYRNDAGQWRQIAGLRGGYGTTGQEVVFALPLADVGLAEGGRITSAVAFSAVGSSLTGSLQPIDQLSLTH